MPSRLVYGCSVIVDGIIEASGIRVKVNFAPFLTPRNQVKTGTSGLTSMHYLFGIHQTITFKLHLRFSMSCARSPYTHLLK